MTNASKIVKAVGHECETAIPGSAHFWWEVGPVTDVEGKDMTTCQVQRMRSVGAKGENLKKPSQVGKFTVTLPHSSLRDALRQGQLNKMIRLRIQDDLATIREKSLAFAGKVAA